MFFLAKCGQNILTYSWRQKTVTKTISPNTIQYTEAFRSSFRVNEVSRNGKNVDCTKFKVWLPKLIPNWNYKIFGISKNFEFQKLKKVKRKSFASPSVFYIHHLLKRIQILTRIFFLPKMFSDDWMPNNAKS